MRIYEMESSRNGRFFLAAESEKTVAAYETPMTGGILLRLHTEDSASRCMRQKPAMHSGRQKR